jgi:hypothetical protein
VKAMNTRAKTRHPDDLKIQLEIETRLAATVRDEIADKNKSPSL